MEHDKNENNAACFDCCFHPDALKQIDINKRFRESVVSTAIEGVEEAYKRQNQPVSYYILHITYSIFCTYSVFHHISCSLVNVSLSLYIYISIHIVLFV